MPTSLHALLAARLDKLAEAKPLLQVGSVFGRQFAVADLQAVAGCDDAELRAMIDRSVGAGLLQEAERGNDKILAFKHALVQDAAYGGLLNSEKRRLHASVLAHFEKYKDWLSAGAGLAVLASHAERGEVWDKATRYLIASLDQAIRSSANHEAVALYDRTLKALEQLPPSASVAPAVDARLHVFSPLLALGEIERLVEVMHQATALAHELGDKRRMAATTSQLASALWLAGKHATGLRSAEEAVRLANELDDFVLRLSARFNQANLLHATGEIGDAARLYGEIIDSLPGELQLKRFGWPGIPSVLSRGLLTWSLVTLGDFERARRTKDEAMALVERIREPYSMVYAYMGQGLTSQRSARRPKRSSPSRRPTASPSRPTSCCRSPRPGWARPTCRAVGRATRWPCSSKPSKRAPTARAASTTRSTTIRHWPRRISRSATSRRPTPPSRAPRSSPRRRARWPISPRHSASAAPSRRSIRRPCRRPPRPAIAAPSRSRGHGASGR